MGKWIDINDKQPENNTYVLVSCVGGFVRTSFFSSLQVEKGIAPSRKRYGKFGRMFKCASTGTIVTHWMQLPEPFNYIESEQK